MYETERTASNYELISTTKNSLAWIIITNDLYILVEDSIWILKLKSKENVLYYIIYTSQNF